MRRAALLLVPLLLLACDRQPVAPDVSPTFNASADHQAVGVWSGGGSVYLFNGAGDIVRVTDCQTHVVYTNSSHDGVNQHSKCTTENPTGRAVVFTQDNNPYMPGLCGGWPDPDGNYFDQCDWQEVISPSGIVNFTAYGTHAYP